MKKIAGFSCIALLLGALSGPALSATFYELEPNNSFSTAQALVASNGLYDIFGSRIGDDSADYYSFFANAGSQISLWVSTADELDPAIDPALGLFSPTGIMLSSDDDTFGYNPAILKFAITDSGLYRVAVSGSGDFGFTGGGSTGWDYRLTVVPLPAAVWLLIGGMLTMVSFMRKPK